MVEQEVGFGNFCYGTSHRGRVYGTKSGYPSGYRNYKLDEVVCPHCHHAQSPEMRHSVFGFHGGAKGLDCSECGKKFFAKLEYHFVCTKDEEGYEQ